MSQRTVTLAALLPWLGAVVAFTGIAHVAFAEQTFGPVIATKFDTKVAEVGKRLFFDNRLSGDVSLSCSSCHVSKFGFTDGKALSDAYPGAKGFRNTPTLLNVALRKNWFHDGRMGTSLNDVIREMITETYLMNMDMRLMQERLKQDPVQPTSSSPLRAEVYRLAPGPNLCTSQLEAGLEEVTLHSIEVA